MSRPPVHQPRTTPARRRRVTRSVLLVVAGLSMAAAGPALAAGAKEQARAEFDKAQIQYKVGHFQDALDGYSRAYELFPAPAFLFNIGQCHKNLKNYERAIFFFEGYLREEKNPDKRALAESLLAESKAGLEKQAHATTDSARAAPGTGAIGPALSAPPAEAAAPLVAPAATAPPVAPAVVSATPEDRGAPPARSGPPWWLWIIVGGVVAGAAGGYLYWSSGGTTVDPPSGTAGTLDRRGH
jgi:hypothetical protein